MGGELTRRAALACLGSGAATLIFGSYSFKSVYAERGVSVAVSSDISNAFLGVSTTDGATVETGGPTVIGHLTNDFDETLSSVSLEIVEIHGTSDTALEVEPVPEVDDSAQLAVRCKEKVDARDSVVTFRLDANGESVSVSDVVFDVPLDIQCQLVAFGISGSVSQTGSSGKVYFDIRTNGNIEAKITGYTINTKNDLAGVEYKDNGTTFDGKTPSVTFNDPIEVELNKFDTSGGSEKIRIQKTNFVDPDSPDADIVVTLQFQEYSPVSLGIDATYS